MFRGLQGTRNLPPWAPRERRGRSGRTPAPGNGAPGTGALDWRGLGVRLRFEGVGSGLEKHGRRPKHRRVQCWFLKPEGPPASSPSSYPRLALMASAAAPRSTMALTRTVEVSSTCH